MSSASGKASELKYLRIASVLEKEIRTGRLGNGRQLPGEIALAARFAVSRNTMRGALSELARAGLISTRSGKGSYVTFDGRPLDARQGWARALERQGIQTEVTVLRLELHTDPVLAERLGIPSPEFVAIDRMRRIVGGPAISYERSRIPAIPAFRNLPTTGLHSRSLTQTLIDAGLAGDHGEQWVSSRRLTPDEAMLLERGANEWFLHTRRITWTQDDRLSEHVESVLDPVHFRLHLRFEQEE